MSDNKPTSLDEILNREYHCGHCGWDMQLSDATVNEIRATITALVPEKFDGHLTDKGVWLSEYDRGRNEAIDTIQQNFTGQTDNEREDSRI